MLYNTRISSIKALKLINWKSLSNRRVYSLIGTQYELYLWKWGGIVWKDSFSGDEVSFDYVFERAPLSVKKELAFHLDFFNS